MPLNKIVVISSYDVADPTLWSGVPYFYTNTLKEIAREVVIAAPLTPQSTPSTEAKAVYYRSRGQIYWQDRDLEILQARAANVNLLLSRNQDADVVFVFHPPDAAYLTTQIPIAIVHDSTWNQFISSYSSIRRSIAQETFDSGCIAERAAFDKAKWLIFFTNWAASAARREYPSNVDKILVVPPGGNVQEVPSRDDARCIIERRDLQTCKILFVGAELYRKGLDIAADTVDILKNTGVSVEMNVVGIDRKLSVRPMPLDLADPLNIKDRSIYTYGRLSKSIPEERLLLSRLYSEASILLAPSRADCGSLALCDAAAFGLPSVSSGVGGIEELVEHGKSGLIMGPRASPHAYAEGIKALISDSAAYMDLCLGARTLYEKSLNWHKHVITFSTFVDS